MSTVCGVECSNGSQSRSSKNRAARALVRAEPVQQAAFVPFSLRGVTGGARTRERILTLSFRR